MQPDRIELPIEETDNGTDAGSRTVKQEDGELERGWEETDGQITDEVAVAEEWRTGNADSDNLESALQKELETIFPTDEDAERKGIWEYAANKDGENNLQKNRMAGELSEEHPKTTSAERIFELCPVIWPFAEPWAERCVKLELEDIGLLPAEHWQLTTNSFLMHSYYGYRHLVLARVRDGARYRYELLVPGIYNEREKEIAGLFGFDEFRNTKSRPIAVGEYGYWSMPVVFG